MALSTPLKCQLSTSCCFIAARVSHLPLCVFILRCPSPSSPVLSCCSHPVAIVLRCLLVLINSFFFGVVVLTMDAGGGNAAIGPDNQLGYVWTVSVKQNEFVVLGPTSAAGVAVACVYPTRWCWRCCCCPCCRCCCLCCGMRLLCDGICTSWREIFAGNTLLL